MKSNRARRKAKAPLSSSAAAKVTGRPRDARIDTEVISAVFAVSAGHTGASKGLGATRLAVGGQAAHYSGRVGTSRSQLMVLQEMWGGTRSSLYRRWPSKRHLVAYAVVGELGEHPAADTGTLRGDLFSAATTLWRAFRGPLGHALAGLAADMAQDAALASSIRRETWFRDADPCGKRSNAPVRGVKRAMT